MRKEAGCQWYNSIGLALSCSRGNFQTKLCWPNPVRGLKLLREPCFCHLKAIIVPNNGIVSESYEKIGKICMPRGEFKHRYWFFADAPNIGSDVCVIWKDLLWSSDSYRLLKNRGGCTIPLFQISVWCKKCVAARHYAVICKQLLNANDINRVRWVVVDLLYRMGRASISLKISARIA